VCVETSLKGEGKRRGILGVNMVDIHYLMYENGIMKPNKTPKGVKEQEGFRKSNRSKCMYGNIAMKPFCTINLCK
jgi:hypothetical protein